MTGNEHLETRQSRQVGGVFDSDIGSSSTGRAVDIFGRFGCRRRRFRDGSRHFVVSRRTNFNAMILADRVRSMKSTRSGRTPSQKTVRRLVSLEQSGRQVFMDAGCHCASQSTIDQKGRRCVQSRDGFDKKTRGLSALNVARITDC